MKVMNLNLEHVQVTLRLTASKLAAFASETGSGGNTLFAVMDTLDDLEKQGALFTAALTYKGNNNTLQDGFDLIDALADAGYTPVQKKELILELAEASGVIGRDDAAKVLAAIRTGSAKLYDAAVAVLSGEISNLPAAEPGAEEPAENPTQPLETN